MGPGVRKNIRMGPGGRKRAWGMGERGVREHGMGGVREDGVRGGKAKVVQRGAGSVQRSARMIITLIIATITS